jgi:hypothetical protein
MVTFGSFAFSASKYPLYLLQQATDASCGTSSTGPALFYRTGYRITAKPSGL